MSGVFFPGSANLSQFTSIVGYPRGWTKEAPHGVKDPRGMERLGQHIESMAIVECFFDEVAGCALSGEKHHFAFRAELAQADREFHACHAGHDHIREEEIGGK